MSCGDGLELCACFRFIAMVAIRMPLQRYMAGISRQSYLPGARQELTKFSVCLPDFLCICFIVAFKACIIVLCGVRLDHFTNCGLFRQNRIHMRSNEQFVCFCFVCLFKW